MMEGVNKANIKPQVMRTGRNFVLLERIRYSTKINSIVKYAALENRTPVHATATPRPRTLAASFFARNLAIRKGRPTIKKVARLFLCKPKRAAYLSLSWLTL